MTTWLCYSISKNKCQCIFYCVWDQKAAPNILAKETITAFSGSQPSPLFFCRIGEFISLRIVLLPTATTITWVQLNQNTTSTFQHFRKFSYLQSLWLTLTFASKKYFKLKDASMHCFDWCFWQNHLFTAFSVHRKNRDKHLCLCSFLDFIKSARLEEDIQVILIHFCGKLNEGNISQKMNHLSLGNW